MTADESKEATCPYCGEDLDSQCKHYLFSRDIHFSTDLELITNEKYNECQKYIDYFKDVVDSIQQHSGHNNRIILKTIRSKRLMCMFDTSTNSYFNLFEYFRSLFRSHRIPFKTTSYTDEGGPGFCSIIKICWSNNPDVAYENMKQGLLADIISISQLSPLAKDIANEFNNLLTEERLKKERVELDKIHQVERKREESIRKEIEIQQKVDLITSKPCWKSEFKKQLNKSFYELDKIERRLFLKYLDGIGIYDLNYEDTTGRYTRSTYLKWSHQSKRFTLLIETVNVGGQKSKTLNELYKEIGTAILGHND